MLLEKIKKNFVAATAGFALIAGCATSTQAVLTPEELAKREFYTVICFDEDGDGKYEAYQLTDGERFLPIEYLSKELSYEDIVKIEEGKGRYVSGKITENKQAP